MTRQQARVALVTGATSGIGLAVAQLLAIQGHRVFLGARTPEDVASAVKELREDGLDVDGTPVDVRSAEGVRAFGWSPRTACDDGLAETVAWYSDNPQWWKAARNASSTVLS